jgi:hypothetical protein
MPGLSMVRCADAEGASARKTKSADTKIAGWRLRLPCMVPQTERSLNVRAGVSSYTWVEKEKTRAGGGRPGCQGCITGKINEPSEASVPAELADRELRPRGRREPEPHAVQEAVPAGERA